MPSAPDCESRPLRADAASNRERIVAAARHVFGRDGVDAPMTAVASEAGVGIATVYRRFPERDGLVTGAFAEALAEHEASITTALAANNPWEGFAGLLQRMGEIEARNRGFTHLMQSAALPLRGEGGIHDRSHRGIDEVVRRARVAGVVRDDLTPEDVALLSFALAGILETTRDDVPEAWRRHLALVLDGCRPGSTTPLPPPSEPRLLQRAMIRSARRRQTR